MTLKRIDKNEAEGSDPREGVGNQMKRRRFFVKVKTITGSRETQPENKPEFAKRGPKKSIAPEPLKLLAYTVRRGGGGEVGAAACKALARPRSVAKGGLSRGGGGPGRAAEGPSGGPGPTSPGSETPRPTAGRPPTGACLGETRRGVAGGRPTQSADQQRSLWGRPHTLDQFLESF